MATKSQRQKGREDTLSSLNTAIDTLNRAKEATNMISAKAALTSAGILLTTIRNSMANKVAYVELGLTCADACEILNRGMDKKRADELSQSILEAIEKLTTTMDNIEKHIARRGKRNAISRRYRAGDDKEAVATWRLDLVKILRFFKTELGVNAHATVSDAHQDEHAIVTHLIKTRAVNPGAYCKKPKSHEGAGGKTQAANTTKQPVVTPTQVHASAPEQSPPQPKPTHITASDIHRGVVNTLNVVKNIHNMLKRQEGVGYQPQSTQNSVIGELPPRPPRIFFGRDELIEKIVHLAECFAPIALIGTGGIGKTSAVLAVLHDDRIKQRFGDNRRFIRCDEFPASRAHFLRRLSKVIGANIENPEDLTPLRQYLSSREMIIVLDNAEFILDPQGMSAREIYAVVDELTRFSNICLCITSRISTIPPGCETLEIPALTMEAARETFYGICKRGEQSDPINDILEQLDFHPLSVTLLATVALHNRWDANRLTREWKRQRTGVLRAQHSGSLAATIELSLASPMFRELGPDARELLGVIAFFPRGVNEENISWLFPAISQSTFDTFSILSLTYWSDGFITMLAPLRDHLRPKDPMSSPLLCTAKEIYFSRLSVGLGPGEPSFTEGQWVTSEDVNVEHLLDVLTSADPNSRSAWDACGEFMVHLYWHKPRLIVLGPKIEALPDDHPLKAHCLNHLSSLFKSAGNPAKSKQLLTQALEVGRMRGDSHQVALTLSSLSDANRLLGFTKEGTQQTKEASEIFEKLGDTANQAECLINLARLLASDNQLDAAEEAASRAMDLLPGEGEQFRVCNGHRVLGRIYCSKRKTEKAIHHYEVALGIVSSLNWHTALSWVHYALAELFLAEGRFDDAQVHIERAKSHAVDNVYGLGRATELQAKLWYKRCMFEEAKLEASRAAEIYEKLKVEKGVENCRNLFRKIDRSDLGGAGQETE